MIIMKVEDLGTLVHYKGPEEDRTDRLLSHLRPSPYEITETVPPEVRIATRISPPPPETASSQEEELTGKLTSAYETIGRLQAEVDSLRAMSGAIWIYAESFGTIGRAVLDAIPWGLTLEGSQISAFTNLEKYLDVWEAEREKLANGRPGDPVFMFGGKFVVGTEGLREELERFLYD